MAYVLGSLEKPPKMLTALKTRLLRRDDEASQMSRPIPIPAGRTRRPRGTPSPPESNSSNSSRGSQSSQSSNVSGGVFRMDPEPRTSNTIVNPSHNGHDTATTQAQHLYEVPVTHSQRFLNYQERTRGRMNAQPLSGTPPSSGRNSPAVSPPPYSTYPTNGPAQGYPPSYDHNARQVPIPYQPGHPPAPNVVPQAGVYAAHGGAVHPPPSYASSGYVNAAQPAVQQLQNGQNASAPGRRGRDSAAHVGSSASQLQRQRRR